jgi:hypothetical protein
MYDFGPQTLKMQTQKFGHGKINEKTEKQSTFLASLFFPGKEKQSTQKTDFQHSAGAKCLYPHAGLLHATFSTT